MQDLIDFNSDEKDHINEETIELLHPYLTLRTPKDELIFTPEVAAKSAIALVGLSMWCIAMSDQAIDTLDLDHPDSGFSWYKVPKLEHLIVSVRHIQHHTAQLADRLRNIAGIGTVWVKNGPIA